MKVIINGHDLAIDSLYEHIEKNQINASYNVPDGDPFPDVSFMANLRRMDSFSAKDDSGADLPIVCEYNIINSFTTNFTSAVRNYSMSLTYLESSDETNID